MCSISWLTAFVNKAAFLPHQLGKYLLLCITLDLQKAKEKKLTYFRILVQLFQMHFVGCTTTYIRLTINTHLPKVCYCAFNHLTWFRIGFKNCNASKIGNYRTQTLDFNYGPLAKSDFREIVQLNGNFRLSRIYVVKSGLTLKW